MLIKSNNCLRKQGVWNLDCYQERGVETPGGSRLEIDLQLQPRCLHLCDEQWSLCALSVLRESSSQNNYFITVAGKALIFRLNWYLHLPYGSLILTKALAEMLAAFCHSQIFLLIFSGHFSLWWLPKEKEVQDPPHHVSKMKKDWIETERKITVVTSREQYVTEWSGFLEKRSFLFCPPTWVPLKVEPETKAYIQVGYLRVWSQGAGVVEKQQRRKESQHKDVLLSWPWHRQLGDPAVFSEDPYEMCFRTSMGDERKKHIFISSYLPLITSGPRVSAALHFELSI